LIQPFSIMTFPPVLLLLPVLALVGAAALMAGRPQPRPVPVRVKSRRRPPR
jgi:hypothetical protein